MEHVDSALRTLVPLESYRSPLLPTLSHGIPALLGTVTPRHTAAAATDPAWWYLVDSRSERIVAFADGNLLVPAASESIAPPIPVTIGAELAIQVLRDQAAASWAAFFSGAVPEPSLTDRLAESYAAVTPPGLWSWLQARCGEYLRWLGGRP